MLDSNCEAVIDSPIGRVGIRYRDGALCGIDFLNRESALLRPKEDDVVEVVAQLERYFDNSTWHFDLPLRRAGTPFQQRVWQSMQQIPTGETRSYGQIADSLKSSPRAVGNACRANPCPIVVPCHRIIGANGLGGFAGQTSGDKMDIKRWLLTFEGAL